MDFVIGAKPGSNAALFDDVYERLNRSECTESALDDLNKKKGFGCGFRITNDIALNDSHADLPVNFLEDWKFDKKGKQTFGYQMVQVSIRVFVYQSVNRSGMSN